MNRCISRKDYLKKHNSNVGYALYVQDNIKKDDYAKLNTGKIVKIIGIRENELDKKAIYFNIYNEDWCNSAAVENFSDNIIDLIEVGDIIEINDEKYEVIYDESLNKLGVLIPNRDYLEIRHSVLEHIFEKYENITILTKELYQSNCYTVERS